MIATILKMNGPVNDELFKRFIDTTPGVAASYLLEAPDDPNGTTVFTVWEDEKSRNAYMASQLKTEVDKSYSNQARTVFRVRSAKR